MQTYHYTNCSLKEFIKGVKLNQLPEETCLSTYNPNNQSITLKDLQDVAQVFQSSNCPKYLELDFSSKEVGSAGVNIIAKALKNNHRCTHLKLVFYGNRIGAKGGEVIAQMLQNCEYLEHLELDFGSNQLGDEGMIPIFQALQDLPSGSCRLVCLEMNFYHNGISEKGAKAIAQALEKSCHFKHFALNLDCNTIAAEGAKAIAEAGLKRRHSSQLQLNLCNNQLGDEGAEAMAPLIQSPHCPTEIDLSHNSIGLKGAKAIANALEKCRDNTEINLTSNKLGDEGAVLLAQALAKKRPDPRYVKLDLARNKIGDQGVKAIAEMLKDFPFHLTLNFYDNNITKKGALAIAEKLPEGPPGLKFKLAQNNLGEGGVKALKAAFQVHHEKFRLPALALVQGERDKQSFIGQLPGDILNQIYVYLGIENHIKDVRSKLDKWNLAKSKKRKTAKKKKAIKKEPAVKIIKWNKQDDHISKVPDPVIRHLFTFFKPSELANMKQTAHRYNELAKKVEAETEAALLSRFDDDIKVITKELKRVEANQINIEMLTYVIDSEGIDRETDTIEDMIAESRKLITIKSDIDKNIASKK